MKKYIKFIVCVLIIILIILCATYFAPQNYSKVYNGIRYKLGNPEYEESVTIKMDGQHTKNIFSKNEFKGTIFIHDDKYSNLDIKWDQGEEGNISYWEGNSFNTYGFIYISKNFEEITICVYEYDNINKSAKHWSSSEGLVISVPANNREEALMITNKLMKKDLINPEDNIIILK